MPLVQPITGLVFAIDFRHNGKDAWWRAAGSAEGSLEAGATVSGGLLVIAGADDALRFAMGAASQTPGEAGAVMMRVTFPAIPAGARRFIYIQPKSASANNLVRAQLNVTTGFLAASVTNSDDTATVTATGSTNVAESTRDVAIWWDGWDGSGTCRAGIAVDGAAPTIATGADRTRTEADATGKIHIGNDSGTTLALNGGSVGTTAIFNVTNPAGQDLTAAGWSAAAIWDAIFPQQAGSRHTGYGVGANGAAVRRFFG